MGQGDGGCREAQNFSTGVPIEWRCVLLAQFKSSFLPITQLEQDDLTHPSNGDKQEKKSNHLLAARFNHDFSKTSKEDKLHPCLARTHASQGGQIQIGAATFKVTLSQLSSDVL